MVGEASTSHPYSVILNFKMNKVNLVILFSSQSTQVHGDVNWFMGEVMTLFMIVLLLNSVLTTCQVPFSAFYPCHPVFSHQLLGLLFFREEKQGEKT